MELSINLHSALRENIKRRLPSTGTIDRLRRHVQRDVGSWKESA
jgi:hypothetical protein